VRAPLVRSPRLVHNVFWYTDAYKRFTSAASRRKIKGLSVAGWTSYASVYRFLTFPSYSGTQYQGVLVTTKPSSLHTKLPRDKRPERLLPTCV
jgi:hypothetical protein